MADGKKMALVERLRARADADMAWAKGGHASPEFSHGLKAHANDLREAIALIERVKVLEEALAAVRDEAVEGANDLDDPITAEWDCSEANMPLITRNVERFGDIYKVAHAALSNATGGEGYGLPSQPRSDGTVARLNIDAEPSGAGGAS